MHPKNKRKPFPKAPKGKHYAEEYEIECGEVMGGIGELPTPIPDIPFEEIRQIPTPTAPVEGYVPGEFAEMDTPAGYQTYQTFGGSYSFAGGGYTFVYEGFCNTCCFPLSPAPEPGTIWLFGLGLSLIAVTKYLLTKR